MKKYILPEKLVWSNLILRWLIGTERSPILLGLIIALVFNIIAGIVGAMAGCFFNVGKTTGFIQQPSTIPAMFAGAAIFAFYIWMPRGIANAINGLVENNVVGTSIDADSSKGTTPTDLEEFSAQMVRSISKWHWWFIPLILSTFSTVVAVLPVYLRYHATQTACTTYTMAGVVLSVIWMIMCIYSIFGFVVYSFLTVFWFNKLFRSFRIRVQLLHPDGAGGLSPLGNLALKLSYPITVIGFVLVLAPMTRQYAIDRTFHMLITPDLIAGMALYLILAPIVFFAPLATAHNSMRQAKNNMLLRIANKFDCEYGKIEEELSKDNSDFDKPYRKMKSFQSLYDDIRKFPVWPFNIDNITRFVTSTVSPIVLAIITNLVARLMP
jgi:hypothetical protein